MRWGRRWEICTSYREAEEAVPVYKVKLLKAICDQLNMPDYECDCDSFVSFIIRFAIVKIAVKNFQ